MASKVISGEAAGAAQPMPWHTMDGTTPLARRSPQSGTRDGGNDRGLETGPQLAQRSAAEAEKNRQVAEAREAGRREGEAAGRRAAEAEMQPILQRLAASIQQASELPARLRTQAETDMVKLAVAIAQRILQRELNIDPEVIAGLVRVGLEKVRMQDVVRVRVCPDHVAALKECLARSAAGHVEVSADPAQERGGVIFETSRGKLDVSIGTQLREIERGLTDRLKGQG